MKEMNMKYKIYTTLLLVMGLSFSGCNENNRTKENSENTHIQFSSQSSSSSSLMVVSSSTSSSDTSSSSEYVMTSSESSSSSSEVSTVLPESSDFSAIDCSDTKGCFTLPVLDTTHGIEPWISNGDKENTLLLSDFNTDDIGSFPEGFYTLGKYLFFSAITAEYGRELYSLDTSTSEVVLLKDISIGSKNSRINRAVSVGEKLFFVVNTTELYISDGTTEGTKKVGESKEFENIKTTTKWFYYTVNQVLHRTDGSDIEILDSMELDYRPTLWSMGDTLLIWDSTTYPSKEANQLYTISDDETTFTYIDTVEDDGTTYPFQPIYLMQHDNYLYFSSALNFGKHGHILRRYDTQTKKIEKVLNLEYENGGDRFKYMRYINGMYYIFVKREYSYSSGTYTSETGAVTDPASTYNALYRYNGSFANQELLFREEMALHEDGYRVLDFIDNTLYLTAYRGGYKLKIFDVSTQASVDTSLENELPYSVQFNDSGFYYSFSKDLWRYNFSTNMIEKIIEDARYFSIDGSTIFMATSTGHNKGTELVKTNKDGNNINIIKNINSMSESSEYLDSSFNYTSNVSITSSQTRFEFGDFSLFYLKNTEGDLRELYLTDYSQKSIFKVGSFSSYNSESPMLHVEDTIYFVATNSENKNTIYSTRKFQNTRNEIWSETKEYTNTKLLITIDDLVYFERSTENKTLFMTLNIKTDEVELINESSTLLDVFRSSSFVQKGEFFYYLEENKIMSLRVINQVSSTASIFMEGIIDGDIIDDTKNGFYISSVKEGSATDAFRDVNTTVSIQHIDVTTEKSTLIFEKTDRNLGVEMISVIDNHLIYKESTYDWESYTGLSANPHKAFSYTIKNFDLIDKSIDTFAELDAKIYANDTNPNIIFSVGNGHYGYERFIEFWFYNVNTHEKSLFYKTYL